MSDLSLLSHLLTPVPARSFVSVADFRAAWAPLAGRYAAPVDRAFVGGHLADRLGYAFAAGYAAALCQLVGGDGVGALCVTEAKGGHPRAIETRLTPDGAGYRLDGAKLWATLAADGDGLLVAASEGWEGEQNRIRLVRVPANAPGVTMTPLPPTPFTPEIPHYGVVFERVFVGADALLPGDGYARYVKPFRTIEDVHVVAATTAHLLGTARREGWPEVLVTRLAALVVAVRGVALAPPDDAGVQVAVHGCLEAVHSIAALAEPLWGDTEAGARWRRDAPLLRIAERVRRARLDTALARLGGVSAV